jgi:hypothetical protein
MSCFVGKHWLLIIIVYVVAGICRFVALTSLLGGRFVVQIRYFVAQISFFCWSVTFLPLYKHAFGDDSLEGKMAADPLKNKKMLNAFGDWHGAYPALLSGSSAGRIKCVYPGNTADSQWVVNVMLPLAVENSVNSKQERTVQYFSEAPLSFILLGYSNKKVELYFCFRF